MEWISENNNPWVEYSGNQWNTPANLFYLLKQIWTDETYVYAATTDGLNIIELESELAYAHITYSGGFNSVWANGNNVYLATPASGIKYIRKTCISGSTSSPYELITCLTDYLSEPDILSNQVRYLHGSNGYMVISTASGINARGPNLYYQNAKTETKYARKVFTTSTGKFYYITYDGSKWKVNIVNDMNSDWTDPDKIYEVGSALINSGVDILDIFVTEGTSYTGISNTIFIATTSGVYVIDEEEDAGDTYYTA